MIKSGINVQELRERIAEKAKAEPGHRFWGLYTHVCKPEVLREAYRLARSNNGAPGIDGVTFKQIEEGEGAEQLLDTLSRELAKKTYTPRPCRLVQIPKENGKFRMLKIPTIRDRVVQGALALVMEPIFEADFHEGSYGYRPGRTAHQALDRVKAGLYKRLHLIIDLDLKAYFDTVRHDLLLTKLAKRIQDDDVLWLSKRILKGGGKRGLPQGSVIGPLWANVFLNEVDDMLEEAQAATRQGEYETISYTRFADDLLVQVSNHPRARHWLQKVEKRLKEELTKLDLTINEEKSGTIDFGAGEPVQYLGYEMRWVKSKTDPTKKMVLSRPQRKKRTGVLKKISGLLRSNLSVPVAIVVKEIINPVIRGWVNYFSWGNPTKDQRFVRWQIETKVRKFASRQRPKRRGARRWTTWSSEEIYGKWGLFSNYRVLWSSAAKANVT